MIYAVSKQIHNGGLLEVDVSILIFTASCESATLCDEERVSLEHSGTHDANDK